MLEKIFKERYSAIFKDLNKECLYEDNFEDNLNKLKTDLKKAMSGASSNGENEYSKYFLDELCKLFNINSRTIDDEFELFTNRFKALSTENKHTELNKLFLIITEIYMSPMLEMDFFIDIDSIINDIYIYISNIHISLHIRLDTF